MEYTFKFTQQEMQVLIGALQELPAKFSLPLIAKLSQGQQEQDKANAIPYPTIDKLKVVGDVS
jgi:hypothetical protein